MGARPARAPERGRRGSRRPAVRRLVRSVCRSSARCAGSRSERLREAALPRCSPPFANGGLLAAPDVLEARGRVAVGGPPPPSSSSEAGGVRGLAARSAAVAPRSLGVSAASSHRRARRRASCSLASPRADPRARVVRAVCRRARWSSRSSFRRVRARARSEIRHRMKQGYPLNLSISLSGGEETNQDAPSNGE